MIMPMGTRGIRWRVIPVEELGRGRVLECAGEGRLESDAYSLPMQYIFTTSTTSSYS